MKIQCEYCMGRKDGHVIRIHKHYISIEGESGYEKTTQIKVHKHHQGNKLCKGSNRIQTTKKWVG